jgi:chromosome segregation ATPase
MDQLTESKFNYSQLQPEMANFLKEKENNMRETVSDAYYQLGKELKEAQDKLAGDNQYNGIFQKWYESLGFSKSTVYRYMNYHELLVSQWDKQELIESLPKGLAYEIAKKSADPELKQQVLDGDITSHKEFKKLKKEKEKLEEEKEQLEESNQFLEEIRDALTKERDEERQKKISVYEKLRELKEKDPEVVEKEVVPEEVKKRIEELEERAGDLKKHKSDVKDYQEKKNKISDEISDLQDYLRELRNKNNQIAKKAEVVQGICGPIREFKKSKGEIETLLKKNVQLDPDDLNTIALNADLLNEISEELYSFIATQKSNDEGEIIDV